MNDEENTKINEPENTQEYYEKLRNKPNVIAEVVDEIMDTFKPDDAFIIALVKRLVLEMEDYSFMVQMRNLCEDFFASNKGLILTKEQIEQAKKKLNI